MEIDPGAIEARVAHPDKIVSAQWLSAHLGLPGLKVVETDEDSLLYSIGHIPGAIRINWLADLNDLVRRNVVDSVGFSKLMASKGISRDDTVVIYGDKGNRWAAYAAWVFELFGHRDVRLLDGGRDNWMGEEREAAFDLPFDMPTSYPAIDRDDRTNRIFATELHECLRDGKTQIVDVRDPERFAGADPTHYRSSEPITTVRFGHIPGALNLPWDGALRANACFRPVDKLAEYYADLDPSRPIIVYCRMGEMSAVTWFLLRHVLGFEDVRLYDGSWAEWGNAIGAPIER